LRQAPREILREVVDGLRQLRRGGARTAELVAFLDPVTWDAVTKTKYLKAAFLIERINLFMMPVGPDGRFVPEPLNQMIDPFIDEAAPRWQSAEPYPDLYRRRDREVFRALARETGNIFFVCSTNPWSGKYVGQPGYRPCPWYFGGAVRTDEPNAGMIAWEPEAEGPLRDMGLRVAPAAEGFVVRDAAGAAFFPGYELHGVYNAETGVDAWTGRAGDRLRAELNRGFGLDLIQTSPRDSSERRLALPHAHPARGPKLPVLQFSPDGDVRVVFEREVLQKRYADFEIDWAAAYG
jgi:hypothetical protein